jgi:hypothetical protein
MAASRARQQRLEAQIAGVEGDVRVLLALPAPPGDGAAKAIAAAGGRQGSKGGASSSPLEGLATRVATQVGSIGRCTVMVMGPRRSGTGHSMHACLAPLQACMETIHPWLHPAALTLLPCHTLVPAPWPLQLSACCRSVGLASTSGGPSPHDFTHASRLLGAAQRLVAGLRCRGPARSRDAALTHALIQVGSADPYMMPHACTGRVWVHGCMVACMGSASSPWGTHKVRLIKMPLHHAAVVGCRGQQWQIWRAWCTAWSPSMWGQWGLEA